MKLNADAVIAPEKVNRCLLVRQVRGDKSAFLARAGYDPGNPTRLLHDLRTQVLTQEVTPLDETAFGQLYEIRALLEGPTDSLRIRSIWMKEHLSGSRSSLP